MFKTLLLVTTALFISGIVHAEIYKWTDKKGNVHYSDRPAENSRQLNISVKKSKAAIKSDGTREERRRRLTQAMTEDRLEKEEKKAQAKNKKNKLNRQCIYAKDRLRNYKRAGRLYDLDKTGKRYTLSDKERKKSIAKLQKQIKKNCK